MTKKMKPWLNIIFLTIILIAPGLVFADETVFGRLQSVAVTNGPYQAATETSLSSMLGIVIAAILSILGVIFLIIIILAGYKWMMAQGNKGDIDEAKESITRAVIGILIIISSWAIWQFVYVNLINKV